MFSLLEYFESKWSRVRVAPLVVKTFLWSSCRRSEIAGLRWECLRQVGDECHFEITGKAGVEKWFRIPEALFREIEALRTNSPYVFAAYQEQLRAHHASSIRPWLAAKVATVFSPERMGNWLYKKVKEWAEAEGVEAACIHVFRKTTLQYTRSGEDVNQRVAEDARVTVGVMMKHYAKESDPEMRAKSNRTFYRIADSLDPEVALRFGFVAGKLDLLEEKLKEAVAAGNFELVARLAAELAKRKEQAG